MAGAGFKTFNTGDILTASDVNTYLMQQTVMVFANSTARSTAIGANVAEGMLTYLKDTKNTEYYNGSTWVVLSTGGDITGVTATSPITGGGTSGTVSIGIQDATTAQKGAVQLTDSIGSTSITTAATPNSVKTTYDTAITNNIQSRQYAATQSVFGQLSGATTTAENLLKESVFWIDAAHSSSSGQTITNLGWGGSALNCTAGSSTSSDSNDPLYLAWTGTNYVYTPGTANNYLSVPDATNLRITGDLDIRVRVALDDWTPSSIEELCSKRGASGNRGWMLRVNTNGTLVLQWSADGTNEISSTSTIATGITDGTIKWVRAVLDVDNGSSGNDVKFYTSDDAITWTQLGSTVTTAGTTSIYASTAPFQDQASSSYKTGKIYRIQMCNGIEGVAVLDINTNVINNGSATSFNALTGQTVTINRSTSGRKTTCVVNPVWLFGTDDYMEVDNRWLEHTGTNYLYLPGVASNYASAPDSAALSITGDLDLRVKVAMDDWTPSAGQVILGKRVDPSNFSYAIVLNTNGTILFQWSATGSAALSATSTVAPTVSDGSTIWIRVTLDVDNGASGRDVIFYTSTNGTTWTQLGTTVTSAGVTSIYDGTAALEIGSWLTGANAARGKFFRAQVLNGIGGTVAFDANFETSITTNLPTTFTESSANAATVTVNYSGTGYRSAGVIASTYVYPGNPNTFKLSATNLLNFGLTDSFSLVAVARNWTTFGTNDVLISSKDSTTNTVQGYFLGDGASTATDVAFQVGDGTNGATAVGATRTSGLVYTITGVRNTSSDNLIVYLNGTAGTPVTDSTTGSSVFYDTVRIGRLGLSGTEYNDVEIIAAAIFRRALTANEVATISSYYAGRVGA